MVYSYHILHTYAYQHFLASGMQNNLFDRHGFAEQLPSLLLSVCENPHNSISNVAYLILSSHHGMQYGGEGLPSIIVASQGILVKKGITLESHGIINQFCILMHFNIIETQVCKTVIRFCQDKKLWQRLVTVLHTV